MNGYWKNAALSSVVSYGKGKKPRILQDSPADGFVPYIDIAAFERGDIRQYAEARSSKLISKKDVLVVWDGARFGLIGMNQEGAAGSTLMVLTPQKVETNFLAHFIHSKFKEINANPKGTGIPHVNPEIFWNLEIPLPPLEEQRRIADKLDVLLAKVNKCKSRLERIPEILKRFRQSVLADACSGKLTEDWREENGASAPIECRLGDALMDIRYGTAKKCEPNTSGVAVLRIPNVIHGEISHNDLKYTQLAAKEYSTLKLQAGDVLVIRSNGSISLVGAPALVTKAEAGFAFAGYLIRLRTDASKLVPAYLNYCLQSPQIRTQYGFTARSTSGVHNINGKEIASLSVNLPSLHEQKEIVRRINSLFEHARKLEERFEKGKTAFLRISESILSKAFRGELVGQDA